MIQSAGKQQTVSAEMRAVHSGGGDHFRGGEMGELQKRLENEGNLVQGLRLNRQNSGCLAPSSSSRALRV